MIKTFKRLVGTPMMRLLLLGVLCGTLFPWSLAWAEEDLPTAEEVELADEHYRMAVALFGQGRYRESVAEFDRALEILEDPLIHCNRAVPLIKLEELREAHRSLERCRDAYPEGSQERSEIAAEAAAVGLILEVVRPIAMEVAARSPERVQIPDEVEGPERRQGPGWMVFSGAGLLGAGAALGAGALVWDLQSASVVEEFLIESEGGPGTSQERYEELYQEVAQRQQVFRILAISGASTALVGAGLLAAGILGRPAPLEAGLQEGGVQISVRLHF